MASVPPLPRSRYWQRLLTILSKSSFRISAAMTTSARRNLSLFPDWLVRYRTDWLKPDVIAGLTTAAVVIPKAMAYGTIAGLPVQVGLYTAFLPMVIYAVLGASRVLSVSTTTTIAILTAAELGEVVPNGDPAGLLTASACLTLLVGAILIIASLLRLGFVANFISEPVLVGFKAGIGVVIILDQIPKILGVHFPRGSFLQNVLSTINSIPHISLVTLAVGRHRRCLLAQSASPRCGVGGTHPPRFAKTHSASILFYATAVAWSARYRINEFHGNRSGGTCFCEKR